MLAQETVQQLQQAPMADRIEAIEVLLQSLKRDIAYSEPRTNAQKRFTVRTFNLGADISVDRGEMYTERGWA